MDKPLINKKESGFTLLELLVVIALMGILYTITLSDYHGMNKKIELQNTAYDVALAIRESQVYGINKKLDSGEFSDEDPYPFGLHIDLDDNKKLIIFRDKGEAGHIDKKFDGNCTSPAPPECERILLLGGKNKINKVFLNGTEKNTGKFNILFKRPNPDATIIDESNTATSYSKIGIEVTTEDNTVGDGYTACIKIGSAGDISIDKICN